MVISSRMGPAEPVTTTAMATDGRAVGRLADGKVVFVEGALPGEDVLVSAVSERSRFAVAGVLEVLRPSPDRIAAPCPHVADGCGGCQWQHASLAGQRRMKESLIVESLGRIGRLGHVPLRPTVELADRAWRTTIRAAVVDGRAALRMGTSHAPVAIDGCLVAHPLLVPLLDGRRFGRAGSVLLRCGARTGERLARPTPAKSRIDVPDDVATDHIHEEAAGRRWRVSAASFFQSRADGADALAFLVAIAAEELGRPGRAVDAYAGVGLFAGTLAEAGWQVTAVEGSASSVADARVNLAGFGSQVQSVQADVTRWSASERHDLVVADPSRRGLAAAGVDALLSAAPFRIVLVSCDVASLGRDAGLLSEAGYELTSVTPLDMFPHTWHVEVVSVFDRPASAKRIPR